MATVLIVFKRLLRGKQRGVGNPPPDAANDDRVAAGATEDMQVERLVRSGRGSVVGAGGQARPRYENRLPIAIHPLAQHADARRELWRDLAVRCWPDVEQEVAALRGHLGERGDQLASRLVGAVTRVVPPRLIDRHAG